MTQNISRHHAATAKGAQALSQEDVLDEFRQAGALLEGHFILTSGRRSAVYLNKSIVGMYPERVERLARAIAGAARARSGPQPAYVLAPVMGAVVFGYEVARQLGVPFMFMERGADGAGFALRRGFGVPQGAPVLVVEDIVSSGLSARDAVDAAVGAGAHVLGVACLVDRSGGSAGQGLGVPLYPLAQLTVPDYDPADLPPELAALPAVKPGSRPEPESGASA